MIKRCLLVVMGVTAVLTQDSVDELIEEIYGSCVCVPYYQCNNNSRINNNGIGMIDIRIQGECASYMDTCCKRPKITKEKLINTPLIEKKNGCGYRNPDGVGFRIIGDVNNETQFGEFPWMVAILRETTVKGNVNILNKYHCGGALIHPQVVLTAAHCVVSNDKIFKIRAGEWDSQTKNELLEHQNRNVKTVIIHPKYYSGALYNDVALLILDQPLKLAENVDVVCLPPQDAVIDSAECFTSGWGKDAFGKEGKYQAILKKVNLPIVNRKTCQEKLRSTRLGQFFELHPSFVCAGGEAGKDACKGDGGSPLVCPIVGQTNRFVQAGIVAWGIGCGDDIPGVYANVAGFRNWINEQMIHNNLDTKSYQY